MGVQPVPMAPALSAPRSLYSLCLWGSSWPPSTGVRASYRPSNPWNLGGQNCKTRTAAHRQPRRFVRFYVQYITIHYNTLHYITIPYHAIPYHAIPYHTIPCHTIPYHAIPYHTMPCHTIPYHTIPYIHTHHEIYVYMFAPVAVGGSILGGARPWQWNQALRHVPRGRGGSGRGECQQVEGLCAGPHHEFGICSWVKYWWNVSRDLGWYWYPQFGKHSYGMLWTITSLNR